MRFPWRARALDDFVDLAFLVEKDILTPKEIDAKATELEEISS